MTDPFEDVPGFLTLEEGLLLQDAVAEVMGKGAVVEIGSYVGRSTCFLAEAASEFGFGPIFAVDHFKGSPEHQGAMELVRDGSFFPSFKANLERHGLLADVAVIHDYSYNASEAFCSKVALLFLDGDHERPERDLMEWKCYLEQDSLVAMHDVGNGLHPKVKAAYDDVLINEFCFQPWRHVDTLYIARRPA